VFALREARGVGGRFDLVGLAVVASVAGRPAGL